MVVFVEDKEQKEAIARKVLEDLTDWFGIPESRENYIKCSKDLPFWAEVENNRAKGFISLKETSTYTAEIHVMGVLKVLHNQGIGTRLFEAFYEYAKKHGYSFIQVKTVQEGHYIEYDKTIEFYKKLGFKEFECFPSLWDEWNPCQIFIMAVQ